MRRNNPIRVLITGLAAALFAGPVQAHLNATGLGPVYDGVLHFLTSPEDLVPVIALSLLAGLRGADFGRRTVFTLSCAWILGSLAGMGIVSILNLHPAWSALSFMLLGGLVLSNARLPLWVLTTLAGMTGAVHGLINGSGVGWSGAGIVALLGITATVFVLSALLAAFVTSLKAHWARISVRVAGSWIAATGILMAGWAWQAGGPLF